MEYGETYNRGGTREAISLTARDRGKLFVVRWELRLGRIVLGSGFPITLE